MARGVRASAWPRIPRQERIKLGHHQVILAVALTPPLLQRDPLNRGLNSPLPPPEIAPAVIDKNWRDFPCQLTTYARY